MMNRFYQKGRMAFGLGVSQKLGKSSFMILLSVFFSFSVLAQDLSVSGKVSDKSGAGLPAVTVQVKGTTKATTTDMDGNYKLAGVPGNATLVYSFVGMTSQEVAVNGRSAVNVTLLDDAQMLEQVVVVGYGTQKVKDATGSVASIGTKDFNKGVIATSDQLLQGRVAGVNVAPTSGEPGAANTVMIRGISSLSNNNGPLYVIDGVPLTDAQTQTGGTGAAGGGVDVGAGGSTPRNPLAFLNPSDIENISILKDASAAAIYGSRGAQGVILITTKKGAGGQGLSFGASVGISNVSKKYDLLNASDFLKGVTKAGGDATSSTINHGSSTNWQDQIFRTAITHNYNLGYGAAIGDDFRYRATVGYQNQQGTLKKTGLDRMTARLNFTKEFLHDKLIFDVTSTISQVHNQYGQTGSTGYQGNTIGAAIINNPTLPVYNADGSYAVIDNTNHNPVQMINLINDKDVVNRALLNLSGSYKITNNLTWKSTIGIDRSNADRKTYYDPKLNGYSNTPSVRGVSLAVVSGNGMAVRNQVNNRSFLVEHTLTYDKTMANSHINLLGGYSYQNFTTNRWDTYGYGAGSTFGTDFAGYKNNLSVGDTSNYKLQSFFGRVNYEWADKYYFTGTARYDGSSKFGENNKYGFFPSASFKYKLFKESFIPKNIFNDLAIRIGWGQTGNSSFAPYQSQSVKQYNYNGSTPQLWAGNPNLKWETMTTTNIGLDFAILNGRLQGTVDYFDKNTTNMLFLAIAAQPTFSNQRWVNLDGKMNNRGVEIGLVYQVVQGKDFTWEMIGNGTFLKYTMKNFGSTNMYTGAINGQGLSGAYGEIITANVAPFSFYMPTFTGFDANGFSTYANGGNSSVVGSSLPTFNWGFTNNFTYKKWNASIFWSGQKGNMIYNNTANALFLAGSLKTGHNVTYSVYNSNEAGLNAGSVSTRFLEKGDFARLQNATVGYTFDMRDKAIKALRLSLTGQNLWTITKYTGLNPQVNAAGAGMNGLPSFGIDYASYPASRTFTVGLNANF